MQVDINSYHDIGDYLREVRESLGLDVRRIGHELNIRAKYLVALEEGKIDVMPGKVYARGYLMHYAEYLGLNKNEIAEAFDRMGDDAKMRFFVPEPTSRNYQPGLIVVGLAALVTLVVYYYWYKNHNIVNARDYDMVSPVPERLLDPILADPVMQYNDDMYVDPMLPSDSSLQGDGNMPPRDETKPAPAGTMDVPQTPAPEAAPAEPEATPPAEAAPAPASGNELPWKAPTQGEAQ